MQLTSTAFIDGGLIPKLYTCNGSDYSPPLTWQDVPVGTKSFVLICDDPDAPVGMWDHWLLYNIPATIMSLPEQMQTPPAGALEGLNSWGKTGYGGPCPPDKEHRYFFKLYALDTLLQFPSPPVKTVLEQALEGHILAHATLMGRYDQPR